MLRAVGFVLLTVFLLAAAGAVLSRRDMDPGTQWLVWFALIWAAGYSFFAARAIARRAREQRRP